MLRYSQAADSTQVVAGARYQLNAPAPIGRFRLVANG